MADKEKDSEEETVALRALGPGADEFADASKGTGASLGRTALTIARTLEEVVHSPRLIIIGYKKIKEKLLPLLDRKLEDVPEDNIQMPSISIAGPTLEALRFSIDDDDITDLFAGLLASSMNKKSAKFTHPSFVTIIQQLCPDEAKIIKYLSGKADYPLLEIRMAKDGYKIIEQNFTDINSQIDLDIPELASSYIDNLSRLEIITTSVDIYINDAKVYENVTSLANKKYEYFAKDMPNDLEGYKLDLKRGMIRISNFGRNFINCCVSI